jgi:hypothetical protein
MQTVKFHSIAQFGSAGAGPGRKSRVGHAQHPTFPKEINLKQTYMHQSGAGYSTDEYPSTTAQTTMK